MAQLYSAIRRYVTRRLWSEAVEVRVAASQKPVWVIIRDNNSNYSCSQELGQWLSLGPFPTFLYPHGLPHHLLQVWCKWNCSVSQSPELPTLVPWLVFLHSTYYHFTYISFIYSSVFPQVEGELHVCYIHTIDLAPRTVPGMWYEAMNIYWMHELFIILLHSLWGKCYCLYFTNKKWKSAKLIGPK